MSILNVIGVAYRHATMPTAYVKVGGDTKLAADRNTKKACTKLKTLLPDAIVGMPQLKKRQGHMWVFEIPVTIGGSLKETESIVSAVLP